MAIFCVTKLQQEFDDVNTNHPKNATQNNQD